MKKLIGCLILVLTLGTLVGCSNNDEAVLNVYNWGEYIDESILKDFTEETGIKINYELYETNEIMYQKIKSGGGEYDIIFPSDYMIERMSKENLLQEINLDNIPNYKYIEDRFKNLDYDPDNKYSVPYMWGTVGILYNTKMVDDVVDSWDILWNKKYSGSILMQDSVRDAMAVSLKKLGYSLNSRDKTQLQEAKKILIEQKPLVMAYVIDEVRDKMIGNEAALAVIYSGEAIYTTKENKDLAYSIPKEGSNLWFDGIAIPTVAKHKEEAEKFINYLCKPEVALKNTDYIGYSSPNSGAKELMPKELLNNKTAYPSDEDISHCEVFHDLGDYNEYYDTIWTEIMAH